jgi:hypothetical protein
MDLNNLKTDNEVKKGAKSSINGKKYEKQVMNCCKKFKSTSNDKQFNTQKEEELGGCTAGHDLICNFQNHKDTFIEVKKKSVDWMQMTLIPQMDNNMNMLEWKPSCRAKIPEKAKDEFMDIIKGKHVFEEMPPFLHTKLTESEWNKIKNNYTDKYYECDDDMISRVYRLKGTNYIQLETKGLYHTGNDVHNFGVPYFKCPQRLRVRCKIHRGKVPSSVMASLNPSLKDLSPSPYSLDNESKFPKCFVFIQ